MLYGIHDALPCDMATISIHSSFPSPCLISDGRERFTADSKNAGFNLVIVSEIYFIHVHFVLVRICGNDSTVCLFCCGRGQGCIIFVNRFRCTVRRFFQSRSLHIIRSGWLLLSIVYILDSFDDLPRSFAVYTQFFLYFLRICGILYF